MTAPEVIARLRSLANPRDAGFLQRFFKTGPGEYGAGDVFLGLRVPALRELVREYRGSVPLEEAGRLLESGYHEARLLALLLLADRFARGETAEQERIYRLYLSRTDRINNWDLVDASAEHIVGGWLFARDRGPLYRLVQSPSLWERRIAIIATFHFIRRNDLADTLRLAELLLRDGHDLMHKATGWMLRETGKRDLAALEGFLDRHAAGMPRTMLRYAIEKFPEPRRLHYLRTGRPCVPGIGKVDGSRRKKPR